MKSDPIKPLSRFVLFILGFLLLSLPNQVKANMIGDTIPPSFMVIFFGIAMATFAWTFIVSTSIEAVIVWLIIRKYIKKTSHFIKIVFFVNFLTFTSMYLCVYLLRQIFALSYIYLLAEIIPFVFEYYLYKKFFLGSKSKYQVKSGLSKKRLLISVITSNLTTFLYGFYLIMMVAPPPYS
jgi:hypothetical protein